MDNQKKTLRERWIEALRSGKYKQTGGALRQKGATREQDSFCCLGVLCDVINPAGWVFEISGTPGLVGFKAWDVEDPVIAVPPMSVISAAGVSDDHAGRLSTMNDIDGKNFLQIADWLEEREKEDQFDE